MKVPKAGIAEKMECASTLSPPLDTAMSAPTRPAFPANVGSFWSEFPRVSLK